MQSYPIQPVCTTVLARGIPFTSLQVIILNSRTTAQNGKNNLCNILKTQQLLRNKYIEQKHRVWQ